MTRTGPDPDGGKHPDHKPRFAPRKDTAKPKQDTPQQEAKTL